MTIIGLNCFKKGFNMNKIKQEYSLSQANFEQFATAYYDFGMPPVSDRFMIAQQFIELLYYNLKLKKVTFARGPKNAYSIYLDQTLLARIRDGHLVKLWVPGLTKQNVHTDFLTGFGMEYVRDAGFPDLVHAGNDFIKCGYDLQRLYVPKMKDTGKDCLKYSQLKRFDAKSVVNLGDNFMYNNETLAIFNAKNMRKIGNNCLYNNNSLRCVAWPNVEYIGDGCMYANAILEDVDTPKLKQVGRNCQPLLYDTVLMNKDKAGKSR